MKKTLKTFNVQDFLPQLFYMVQVMIETLPFAKENKLWTGFFEHKWIGLFTLCISVLFSWYLFDDLSSLFFWQAAENLVPEVVAAEMGINTEIVQEEGRRAMFSGGTKYMLLILLEVIIFYFCVKTLGILRKEKINPTFKSFYIAEKRMIKLMAWNFGKGIIAQIFIYIGLSLIGLKDWTGFCMFFVYAYFIGYAFLDNYNEQFNKEIKESQLIIRQHLGAAFSLGLVVTLLMYLPLFGPLLAPIFGGVSASIYGHRYTMELSLEEGFA